MLTLAIASDISTTGTNDGVAAQSNLSNVLQNAMAGPEYPSSGPWGVSSAGHIYGLSSFYIYGNHIPYYTTYPPLGSNFPCSYHGPTLPCFSCSPPLHMRVNLWGNVRTERCAAH